LPALIYYHGGGFVIGNLDTHDSTCRRLANKSRCLVIAIDYRLAPEHPFPAPIDDGVAAFRHIRDNAPSFGADATRLAVGGDSAGGAIAAVVCQACRDAGEHTPAFQMLIYPATDSSKQSRSRREFAEGYFLTKDLIDWFWKAYVPAGADLADLRLSPLLARDLSGLPPAFVLTAGYDPLRDEGRAYADRLIDAGVKTTYVNYPGTIHGFFSLTRFLQQGLKANDEAAAVLAAHFAS
jgi:acetyl esterase